MPPGSVPSGAGARASPRWPSGSSSSCSRSSSSSAAPAVSPRSCARPRRLGDGRRHRRRVDRRVPPPLRLARRGDGPHLPRERHPRHGRDVRDDLRLAPRGVLRRARDRGARGPARGAARGAQRLRRGDGARGHRGDVPSRHGPRVAGSRAGRPRGPPVRGPRPRLPGATGSTGRCCARRRRRCRGCSSSPRASPCSSLAFKALDRALPDLERGGRPRLPADHVVYRPWFMFGVGLATTALTLSVSVSISLLVPLAARGYVRRENVWPYILGANVTTLVDTLFAGALVGHPDGARMVALLMAAVSARLPVRPSSSSRTRSAATSTAWPASRRPAAARWSRSSRSCSESRWRFVVLSLRGAKVDVLVYVDPSPRGEWALSLAAQLPLAWSLTPATCSPRARTQPRDPDAASTAPGRGSARRRRSRWRRARGRRSER